MQPPLTLLLVKGVNATSPNPSLHLILSLKLEKWAIGIEQILTDRKCRQKLTVTTLNPICESASEVPKGAKRAYRCAPTFLP